VRIVPGIGKSLSYDAEPHFLFDRAVAAPPPKPTLNKNEPRPSTALSAVFRRIANEPAAPQRAPIPPPRPVPPPPPPARPTPLPPPRPTAASTPQLLGFAEAVSQVPPVEDFLSREEALAPVAPDPVVATALEAAPPPEPPPAPVPEPPSAPAPPPVKARLHELPPNTAAPPIPSPVMPRPQNLVGRLGRRLGDVPSPSRQPAPAPRFDPLPAAAPPAARRVADPAPAQKLATPGPAPVAERGTERDGRPSLPRNRRLHRRVKLPAEIEIDGVPCTLIDVSIGGFAATGVPQLEPNALVPVMIRLTIDGIEVGTLLKARIIYVTQGRSAGRFVDLSPSQMAFLRYIVTWRGESVGAVGTTTLLDAISTGTGRGFNPGALGPADMDAKSRWWAGLIGRKVHPPR
jgi:hypothetical protein